jgi:hypothetical protein
MRPGWRRLRLHDHAKGKGLFNPAKLTCQFPKNSARLRCVSPLATAVARSQQKLSCMIDLHDNA